MKSKETFDFSDLAESEEFEQFHRSFWELTKVPLGIVDPKFKQFKYFCPEEAMHAICRVIRSSQKGLAACIETDKENCNLAAKKKHGMRYYCHAGLIDFAIPVYVQGRHIATIMFGQMLPEPPTEKSFNKIWNKVSSLSIDKKAFKKAYYSCPYMSSEQLESLQKIISFFAEYFCEMGIRLKNAEKSQKHPEIVQAKEFVSKHFRENIGLFDVANHVVFSEAYFSRLFSKIEGINFSIYLQKIRLAEAKKLLIKTDWPITKVAFNSGFNNLSYFNELFRKYENCTPSDFRKSNKSE